MGGGLINKVNMQHNPKPQNIRNIRLDVTLAVSSEIILMPLTKSARDAKNPDVLRPQRLRVTNPHVYVFTKAVVPLLLLLLLLLMDGV